MKTKTEEIINIKLELKFICHKGEELEVKKRILSLIESDLKSHEGLFTTSWLPWKKTYYFSIRDVKASEENSLDEFKKIEIINNQQDAGRLVSNRDKPLKEATGNVSIPAENFIDNTEKEVDNGIRDSK